MRNPRQQLLNLLPENAVGMEIGVWKGEFSQQIINAASPRVLHLVDPWVVSDDPDRDNAWYGQNKVSQADMDEIYQSVVKRFGDRNEVKIHRKPSTQALLDFENGSLDYVYIDGDHSYEGVRTDLNGCFPKIRAGGLICGDDYVLGRWWKDGVVRALHEFIASHQVIIKRLVGSQFMLQKLDTNGGGMEK